MKGLFIDVLLFIYIIPIYIMYIHIVPYDYAPYLWISKVTFGEIYINIYERLLLTDDDFNSVRCHLSNFFPRYHHLISHISWLIIFWAFFRFILQRRKYEQAWEYLGQFNWIFFYYYYSIYVSIIFLDTTKTHTFRQYKVRMWGKMCHKIENLPHLPEVIYQIFASIQQNMEKISLFDWMCI